ncbi:MAG: PTS sugar transporter subunit IIA, partial [Chitinivibrionales bacterium]|nr:PTS sugar transporter subunit IIA [Chitinivibrionales bacterium]
YEALHELSVTAAHAVQRSPEEVYEVARSREEAMTTALEQGIAIPHARLEGLAEPVVVYGRSRQGIDWNSSDGIPARHTFFILTPVTEADVQLQIYRQLTRVLFDEHMRGALLQASTAMEALGILNDKLRAAYVSGL